MREVKSISLDCSYM